MMTVVSRAKRISDMGALGEPWLSADAVVGRRGLLGGKLGWDLCPIGRHFNTASSEARQGWSCNGMLNVTRMTMAALPMVEAVFAGSVIPIVQLQSTRVHKINWLFGFFFFGVVFVFFF